MQEDNMDIDSIGRVSDTVISRITTPPASVEPSVQQESGPQVTVQDSSKILDLYA
jgi:hypothetical protein